MENHKLIDKLKNETNISYEEAEIALKKSNWDMLDAIIDLEEKGKIKKPSISIFYTNENKDNYKNNLLINNKSKEKYYDNRKDHNTFEGIFVKLCKLIDICNNIFFEIKKEQKVFIKIPVTVIIVLLGFAFGIVVPLYIVGLFFDLEFSLSGNRIEVKKINNAFKVISEKAKKIKGKLKRGFKNG